MNFVSFDNHLLVPAEWQGGGPARAFNPTIAAVGDGYAMCYRVVQEGSELRRFATCLLDADLELVEGSVTPLSDKVTFVDQSLPERSHVWHADPRFVRLSGRLYVLWNDGALRPANHQFLAPMSEDGLHLAGPARELTTANRRPIEKNWAPFEVDGQVFITYKSRPHVVLSVDLDDAAADDSGKLVAEPAYQSGFATKYEALYGILRGGAQPVRDGDSFLVLGHSSFVGIPGRTYRAAFMRFDAKPPFRVTQMSTVPFDLPHDFGTEFLYERLNEVVGDVVYPCGLVPDGDDWVASYGVNDERCAVARVSRKDVEPSMSEVAASFTVRTEEPPRRTRPPAGSGRVSRLVPGRGRDAAPVHAPRKPRVPLFWYDAKNTSFDGHAGRRNFKVGNFGDIASKDIVERVSGLKTSKPVDGRPRMLGIGSVLHRAHEGDVVWGSGVKGGKPPLKEGLDLHVAAVRGPLSIEYLQSSGIDTSRVTELFDPGCLMPHLFADKIARFEPRGGDRIIPHYRDDLLMRRTHYTRLDDFVTVDRSPLSMIKQILGADRVFSSSLHGIVFAESLGIPAYWLAPIGDENELKYYDYYYGTDRTDVKRFESLEEALRSDPMPLPTFRPEDYVATFPTDLLGDLSFHGVRPGQRLDLLHFDKKGLDGVLALSGFDLRDHRGLWMTGTHASMATTLRAEPGETVQVTLTLRPFNPVALRGPQTLRVQANGGPVSVVEWERAKRDSLELVLEVPATAADTPLTIRFDAHHAKSPKSVGSADISEKVAAIILGMRISTLDRPAQATSAHGV